MNKITNMKNKELLWNILFNNNYFKGISNDKLDNVKRLFEDSIMQISKNIINDTNINIIEVNKKILDDIIKKLKLLKEDNNIIELKIMENDLKNYVNIKKPEEINFSDNNDEILEPDDLSKKLEYMKMQRDNELNLDFSKNNIIELNNKEEMDVSYNIQENEDNEKNFLFKKNFILNQEFKSERMFNIANKLDLILKKIEILENNQSIILEKLNLN
jgi:hypothetical protein